MKVSVQYAAGFFDGEGYVGARIMGKSLSRGRWYILKYNHFHILTTVANVKIEPLTRMKKRWGGSLIKHLSKNKKHNDFWVWRLTSKKALRFLQDVLPYLLIKKTVAIAAIRLQKTNHHGGWRNFHVKVNPSEIELRQELYAKIRKLNRRGRLS